MNKAEHEEKIELLVKNNTKQRLAERIAELQASSKSQVTATLEEREGQYGSFADVARLSQQLQRVMRGKTAWYDSLLFDQREALQVIASKISRILNGDPYHIDSWHDIAGYATLIADRLRAEADNDN